MAKQTIDPASDGAGSRKKDAVLKSSALFASCPSFESSSRRGQVVTKVIGSSEEGTVDSVLTCLNSIILFPCSYRLISLAAIPVYLHAGELLCD